ncbi:hypothetical protein AB6G07_10200 [Providencia stuartii]|uniref:hypothetical protein n=1 Tax=Providencia stuartii TaxID=588 RepID=UPI0034DD1A8A
MAVWLFSPVFSGGLLPVLPETVIPVVVVIVPPPALSPDMPVLHSSEWQRKPPGFVLVINLMLLRGGHPGVARDEQPGDGETHTDRSSRNHLYHVYRFFPVNRKGGCGNAIALYINQNLAETFNFTARPGAGIIERVSGSR